jgi:hypothetical protein
MEPERTSPTAKTPLDDTIVDTASISISSFGYILHINKPLRIHLEGSLGLDEFSAAVST